MAGWIASPVDQHVVGVAGILVLMLIGSIKIWWLLRKAEESVRESEQNIDTSP